MFRVQLAIIACLVAAGCLFGQNGVSRIPGLLVEYSQMPVEQRTKIVGKILKANIAFDTLYNLLKGGRKYSVDVQKGFIRKDYRNSRGIDHPNLVFIPKKYDPSKKYSVRVFLHGAVSSFDISRIYSYVNRQDTAWNSVEYIGIYPAGWIASQWWSYSQHDNISRLIDFVKGNYNVDENDISISGISDGATGIYYLANFYSTPFSCFFPYIGSMGAAGMLADRQLYLQNYQGLPFFIVNTAKDHIFNIDDVIPYVKALQRVSGQVSFVQVDTSGHSTRWFPVLQDSIRAFRVNHKRNPFPDRIVFATEKPDTLGRKFWIRIVKLGRVKGETDLEDSNTIESDSVGYPAFARKMRFGQVDATKDGNTVYVKTRGVKKYSLLLSPEHFDFSKPIRLFTNNTLSFEGLVEKDTKTLLKYNAIDNDRTMLYGAELVVTVGREYKRK
jgi:predicted esterase